MKTRFAEWEHRDWLLLAAIILLGILLMLLVGQSAIQMLPHWSVPADMVSKLDPNNQYQHGQGGSGMLQPIRPEILTPMAWMGTFLTPHPGADASDTPDPLVVFDPSVTPSPSVSPSEAATETLTPTVTSSATLTPSTSPTTTITGTPPSATATTPTKTKTSKPPTATPTTATPTATATTATPTASPTTPTASPTTPSPTPTTPSPTPTATGTPVTIDPSLTQIAQPGNVNVGPPDGLNSSPTAGTYYIIDVSSNPIWVNPTPDGNYDLVYYENVAATVTPAPQHIDMDQVIVGISQDGGATYYPVFNWGDGVPDTNTNVDTTTLPELPPNNPAQPEADNQSIPTSALYQDPSAPGSPQTGITIDVDTAPSNPPPGRYDTVVIINPPAPSPTQTLPSPTQDSTGQTDGIDVTEVPGGP